MSLLNKLKTQKERKEGNMKKKRNTQNEKDDNKNPIFDGIKSLMSF